MTDSTTDKQGATSQKKGESKGAREKNIEAAIKWKIATATANELETKYVPHIWARQTPDEQATHQTTEENGIGVNKLDTEFVCSIAAQIEEGRHLTAKQTATANKILKKYWRQYRELFNEDELIAAFVSSTDGEFGREATATENDFEDLIQVLIAAGISKETITTEFEQLINEERNRRYIRNYLTDWISRTQEEEAVAALKDKTPLEYFFKDLGKTVKHDTIAKLCCICTCISTYTENPLNSFLKAESSTGKTHDISQTAKYFPGSDVWFLGGLSPTAIVHDNGTWLDEQGEEIRAGDRPAEPKRKDFDDKETWERARQQYLRQLEELSERIKTGYKLVDISNKLLIFMEAPHPDTIRKLYPILSHDKKEITFKITDKNLRGQLQTITARIRGYPATIICATGRVKTVEETLTRFLTISPVAAAEKFQEANALTNKIFSEAWNYKTKTKEQKTIESYLKAVRRKLLTGNADICIPFNLAPLFPYAQGEDMRHFKHFMQMVQALTAINIFDRETIDMNGETYYLSNAEDVATALMIYSKIIETTTTGKEKSLLEFYHNYLENPNAMYTLKRITDLYNIAQNRIYNSETVRTKIVSSLVTIDYLDQIQNPEDKRNNVYIPIKFSAEEPDKPSNDNKLTINSHLSDIWLILLPELLKSFREWFNNSLKKNDSTEEKKNEKIDDLIKKVCCVNDNFLWLSYISGEFPNAAEQAENKHKRETWQTMVNSGEKQPCGTPEHDGTKDPEQTPDQKPDFKCVCGASFATGKLLRKHQEGCNIFQDQQSREATEENTQ